MAVGNFWLNGQIDGRKTSVEGGPQSKDGGFMLAVKMRDEGGITVPLKIEGRADSDGTLTLTVKGDGFTVTDDEHGVMLRKVTNR